MANCKTMATTLEAFDEKPFEPRDCVIYINFFVKLVTASEFGELLGLRKVDVDVIKIDRAIYGERVIFNELFNKWKQAKPKQCNLKNLKEISDDIEGFDSEGFQRAIIKEWRKHLQDFGISFPSKESDDEDDNTLECETNFGKPETKKNVMCTKKL